MKSAFVFLVCLVKAVDANAVSETASSIACNTSYSAGSAVITSPNYPNTYVDNLDCYEQITTQSWSSIYIIFTSFETESGSDYVIISCPNNSSISNMTLFSGFFLPDPIMIPSCILGLVNFRTDDSVVASGFRLEYYVSTPDCGKTVHNGSNGYVTSPNYPSAYPFIQDCRNNIWATPNSTFLLQFKHFDITFSSSCLSDWLEITCPDNATGNRYLHCGAIPSNYSVFIYGCSRVVMYFHSDSSINGPGFNITYDVYPYSVAECGKTTYNGPSGVISSPNYPGDYSNDLSCDYYIDASSSSSSIAIIFQGFNTQQGIDYVTISCPTNFSYPSLRYSGSSLPQPVSIPWCSQGAVNFITDDSLVSTGFSLDYHISLGGCGNTIYRDSNDIVSSPNYPGNYNINQNCSNIIWTSQRSSFSIIFQDLNMEECCDFVELSCLDNAESGSYRFSGTSFPTKLDILGCTQLLVWFYSDDTVVYNGFKLEYFVTPDSDKP